MHGDSEQNHRREPGPSWGHNPVIPTTQETKGGGWQVQDLPGLHCNSRPAWQLSETLSKKGKLRAGNLALVFNNPLKL